MFTGIIEKTGKVTKIVPAKGNKTLTITAAMKLSKGDSIAVNGVCLTVINSMSNNFLVEVTAETLKSTNFSLLRVGDMVNLERAMVAGDRLGGHFVTGHIDEQAKVRALRKRPGSTLMEVGINPKNTIYIVKKGSVAIEGVSLTVQDLSHKGFLVSLIPYTLSQTTLGKKRIADRLNIEYDLLAKHLIKTRQSSH